MVEEITEEDCKQDFKGFYDKLNRLDKSEKAQEVQAQKDAEQKAQRDRETQEAADIEAKKTQLESAQKAANSLKSYKDIADGLIINTRVLEDLQHLTVKDFIDSSYISKVSKIYKPGPNREAILSVLATFSSLLAIDKVKTFIAGLKGIA